MSEWRGFPVMKLIIYPLSLMVFLLLIFPLSHVQAGPANPHPLTLTNPDGNGFKAMIRGDEFQHWIEAEDGYSVARNPASETWEYAEKAPDGSLRNSGIKFVPGKNAPRKILKGLRPDRNIAAEADRNRALGEIYLDRINSAAPAGAESYADSSAWPPVPVSGQRKSLVILVNFANRILVTTPAGWYGKIFNTTAGVKSVANYYADNSYGLVTLSPALHTQSGNPAGIITVTVSDNHPNSGKSFNYATETGILNHALAEAAPFIDFASYDTNGDGVLDLSELNIYFIYAGYEASDSLDTPSIWGHAWSGDPGLSAGTRQFHHWALNGELNYSGVLHPMGATAHEMGHSLLGLPDLYDTTYHNAGLGMFSPMADGIWGALAGEEDGTTPVNFDAWSRQYLGWSTPVTHPADGTMSFPLPLSLRSSSVMLDPVVGSEYFLAENRTPSGWDLGMRNEIYMRTLPPGGLLILHVDNSIGTPANNDINRYVAGSHQGVMAEEANIVDNCSMLNSLCDGSARTFFYQGNNNAFTDSSSPNSRYYSGIYSYFGLSSISVPGQTMSAKYSHGVPFYLLKDGFEGSGWSSAQVAGSASWTIAGRGTNPAVSPHSGSELAIFNSHSASSGSQARLYTSTGIAFPANYDSVFLDFWMFHDSANSAQDQVQVQVSTDGSSWSDAGVPLKRYDGSTGWHQSVLDLSTFKGDSNVRIGFLGTSEGGNDIHLDDVTVSGYYFNKARVGSTDYYMTLTGAYAEASSGTTIKARGIEFDEDLLCSQSKDIVLEGGYDSVYMNMTGYSVLYGILTIQSGSVAVKNLIIQ
jgi:M6 family metalloprotease-like protein